MRELIQDILLFLATTLFIERAPFLARWIVRWSVKQLPQAQRERYEHDWLSTLEYVDKPLSQIFTACQMAVSVPSLRRTYKAPLASLSVWERDYKFIRSTSGFIFIFSLGMCFIILKASFPDSFSSHKWLLFITYSLMTLSLPVVHILAIKKYVFNPIINIRFAVFASIVVTLNYFFGDTPVPFGISNSSLITSLWVGTFITSIQVVFIGFVSFHRLKYIKRFI